MLTIRATQIQAFHDGFREQFLAEVRAVLPDGLPAMSDDVQICMTIERAVDRAGHYQLKKKPEVCLFACAALVLGEGFDTAPWAAAILSCPVAPTEKMKHLFDAIRIRAGVPGV
jgi:hypothetical protein